LRAISELMVGDIQLGAALPFAGADVAAWEHPGFFFACSGGTSWTMSSAYIVLLLVAMY
jgi:hypothetical protein